MYKIKGFTTKGKTGLQLLKEFSDAGCKELKLPFSAKSELNTDDNILKDAGVTAKDCFGDSQKIETK